MGAIPSQTVHFGCPHCGCNLTIPLHSGPLEGPCPRCAKPIRASVPASRTELPPFLRPVPSIQLRSIKSHQITRSSQDRQVTPASSLEAASGDHTLHCQCPSCGHHHPFAAKDLVQISQCNGCQTTMRLPQKPQPEVPLQQDTAPKKNVPAQVPGLQKVSKQIKEPAPVQSTLDSVVRALRYYEQAGVPSNHPDRLHLLEQFFAACSTEELNVSPSDKHQAKAPNSTDDIVPLETFESQPRSSRSHIPPRRDGQRPEIQPRHIPPVGRTDCSTKGSPNIDRKSVV